jgi:hypothetical protein
MRLAVQGRLGQIDCAIFADPQQELAATYKHLDRLEQETAPAAGFPIYRVTAGDIGADALDPDHRFASMPLHILNQDGTPGMGRRQCTSEYKLKPIKRKVRELLGYPHPTPVPKGVFVEMMIGFSRDEIGRVSDSTVKYMRNTFPLLDLEGAADGKQGWTRADCLRFLRHNGFPNVPKSSCLMCPFHGNAQWRDLRDNHPDEWARAVAFDHAIRTGHVDTAAEDRPLLGTAYLHRSRLPLDQAPIDKVTAHEWRSRQGDLLDVIAEIEDGDPDGCSPWGCRSGSPVEPPPRRPPLRRRW